MACAARRLYEPELYLQRDVAFVLADAAAIEAGERYLDSDLNRTFPGDPDDDQQEQIAVRLCEFVEGRTRPCRWVSSVMPPLNRPGWRPADTVAVRS